MNKQELAFKCFEIGVTKAAQAAKEAAPMFRLLSGEQALVLFAEWIKEALAEELAARRG